MNTYILTVDPDPLTSKMLAFLLGDAGYLATTLADPRRVSQCLSEQPVNLILLEATLPHPEWNLR